ncbi:MAG TPA: hypothetical protein VIV66_16850 [Pyrinomonadaceae bacterium]
MKAIPRSPILLIAMTCLASNVLAQRPQRSRTIPQSARKYYLDEARTRLEEVQDRLGQVVYKGFMSIGMISGRNGSAELNIVELRSANEPGRLTGLSILLSESSQPASEIQSFVDYDEIDSLIKGLDTVARVDDTITKMPNFSASYRTNDDFAITVFKQTRSGIAVRIENSALNGTGGIDRATIYITLDELNRWRGMLLEAKQRLDEMK